MICVIELAEKAGLRLCSIEVPKRERGGARVGGSKNDMIDESTAKSNRQREFIVGKPDFSCADAY